MCVPIAAKLPVPLSKALVLEFLRFIYQDCYGDIYRVTDDRFAPYHLHLDTRISHYEATLPGEIGAI